MHALTGRDLGRKLFRFVVVADTHVNPEDGKTSSPFAANAKANLRAGAAIEDINRWQPACVVHVGDIVHPVPELPSFEPACERFKRLAQGLQAPLHLAAGNHDVGDKPVEWMPAGTVTQEHVETYRRLFGADFYSFDAEGCHFIVINAQVINSGLPADDEQRLWLEQDFARHRDRRTFFFTHYPPYVSERHEPSSYDNIDEPGRTWLLDLITRHRPEALFAGHVHNQWYDLYEQTEIYILPSTAFVRQDYTELFRVAPLRDYGRDDSPKLGYYVVDVHANGHVAHFIRTDGVEQAKGVLASARAPESPVHTKTNLNAPVGVDMRHAWIEWIDIAATGGVQEFERKRTRNDYPAIALWEMGCRKLRIPLQDLLDPAVRSRMVLLQRLGHRYTAYVFGGLNGAARAALYEHRGLIEALEVIVVWSDAERVARDLANASRELALRIYLSKLRRHEDAKFDGSKFNHFINHGFVAAEHEQLRIFVDHPASAAIDGFIVRVPLDRSPWMDIIACQELEGRLRKRIALQIRLAADNPAEPIIDDRAIASRVAETVFAGLCHPDTDIFFDTFVDVDRNYFPHHGFVDRRYDPRLASYVYRHLHAILNADAANLLPEGAGTIAGCRWFSATDNATLWTLILPGTTGRSSGQPASPIAAGTTVELTDLGSAQSSSVRWDVRTALDALNGPALVRSNASQAGHRIGASS